MATTKNITMKQFNGTDYDTLYPKTVAAQIAGAVPIASGGTNGTTASSGVNNLVAGLSQITPASNDLFPFRDISGNTGGSVTLANLVVALRNNGVITSSNLVEQASALGLAKIQAGSYVGTGTYGANNQTVITCGFKPKLVMVFGDYVRMNDYGGDSGIFWGNSGFLILGGSILGYNYFTERGEAGIKFTDTGLSLYSTISDNRQLNTASKTFNWIAVG